MKEISGPQEDEAEATAGTQNMQGHLGFSPDYSFDLTIKDIRKRF